MAKEPFRELAATITTQQPDPISSDVTMLNIMIHSTTKTSPLSITATAMRRAGLLFDAGRAAGSGGFMTGNSLSDDADFVVTGPQRVQPFLPSTRSTVCAAIVRSWSSSPKARSSTANPRVTVTMCNAAVSGSPSNSPRSPPSDKAS